MEDVTEGPLFYLFGLEVNRITVSTWCIMGFLTLLCLVLGRGLRLHPKGRRQIAVELIVDSLLGLLGSVIGSKKIARRYFPVLGSLFIIILISNYSGFIPGFKAPTSAWSYTLGLGLTVFVLTYIIGYRHHRLGYLKHYVKPMAIMIPLIIMEEIVRPLSLSLRLYGNIYGGETTVKSVSEISALILPIPFMCLELLFGFLQALVFTLLTATYLAGAFEGE